MLWQFKRLLYATDLEKPRIVILKEVAELYKLGLKEVILLNVAKSSESEEIFRAHNINVRLVLEKGRFLPLILNTAEKENVSLIIADLEKRAKELVRQFLC
jgi:hypothetical protein